MLRRTLPLAIAIAGLLGQAGCNGCQESAPTPAATTATEGAATAAATPATGHGGDEAVKPGSQRPADQVAPTNPADRPPYRGPTSKNPAGFTITTGFANDQGKPVSQPNALEATTSFITVLDPDDRPLGLFDRFAGAELHSFLLARDMRHAHYTFTSGPVAEGADARKVKFAPREGGDHALIAVFKPVGKSPQAVSTPIVFAGALPQIAGDGVVGLSLQSRVKGGDVRLQTTPAELKVGQAVTFTAQRLDNTGAVKAPATLKFLAVFNDEMGGGEVLTFSPAGTAQWTPSKPGVWLIIAPPPEGKTPLTFKITVIAAETPEKPAH